MKMFDTCYIQGYTAALLDVKSVFEYIDDDMRRHKRKRTAKEYSRMIDAMIKNRAILRENPDAFVRCNNDVSGGYEVFVGR